MTAPVTRDLVIRPIDESDYSYLRTIEHVELGPSWRSRGFVSSPDDFATRLWNGAIQQLVAISENQAVAWLQAYNADFGAAHCEIAVAHLNRQVTDSRAFVAAVAAFIDGLFANWTLDKIYLEVPEFSTEYIDSLIGGLFVVEGRRLDYVAAFGRKWDLLTLAFTKEAWFRYQRFEPFRTMYRVNGAQLAER